MALTLEVSRFSCNANLEKPYVVMLMDQGQLLEQMAYYPSAEAAVAAGLAWVREHRPESETQVSIVEASDP
jgi:hypothetical protein